TIVLLVDAGLLIRSFMKLYNLDTGIRTENLMAMRLQLPAAKYSTPASRKAFFEQLEPRLLSIPGIEAVAASTSVPPLGNGYRSFEIEGHAPRSRGSDQSVPTVIISPRFFDVVAVKPRRGRNFNETDGPASGPVVIVNERFVSMYFSGEDPIGKHLRFTG